MRLKNPPFIRVVVATAFSFGLLFLYQVVNIRLFSFDLLEEISGSLFADASRLERDTSMILFNTGALSSAEIESKIDGLLDLQPKVIGINLCQIDEQELSKFKRFEGNPKVVICNCDEDGAGGSSIRVESTQEITHFKADRPDYFEIKVSDAWHRLAERGNEFEMINFHSTMYDFYHMELNGRELSFAEPEFLRNKVFLVGYLGDRMGLRINDYDLGSSIYDLQASANIISMLRSGNFIEEISFVPRMVFMLIICLVNVAAIRFIQTKWFAVNIIIYIIILIFLSPAAFLLTMTLIQKNTYLKLDELPYLLFVSSVLAIILFYNQEHKSIIRRLHLYTGT